MQLGMIGLGRMGSDMVVRLTLGGHECVVHDARPAAVEALLQRGVTGASSVAELVGALARPRIVWLMVPAAVVDEELALLTPLLETGDIVIDGGNSYYRDDVRRGAALKPRSIHYVDVGPAAASRASCVAIA